MNYNEIYKLVMDLGMDISSIKSLPDEDAIDILEMRALHLFGVDCMLCGSKKSVIPSKERPGVEICRDCESVAYGELYASRAKIDLDEHLRNKIMVTKLAPDEENN